jgi:hypothetical protein
MPNEDDKIQDDSYSAALAKLVQDVGSLIRTPLEILEGWEHGVRREVKRSKELRDNPNVGELYAAIRTKMAIEDVLQDGGKVYIQKKGEQKPQEWKPPSYRDDLLDE